MRWSVWPGLVRRIKLTIKIDKRSTTGFLF
jgi:hypothetical protein